LVSFSIEYPTSSVRIQYTTVSVGISSPVRNRFPAGREESTAPLQRFNKKSFQKFENPATILRKEKGIYPESEAMATICKHPRVRIVSRHEDSEFVECLECGEVFDSEEFRDMEIEETAEPEDALNED
jgi:uncharacterized Zn-finger protein